MRNALGELVPRAARRLLLVFAMVGAAVAADEQSVTAAEVNGTYRQGPSEIQIVALGHNKLKVQLALTYEYNSPLGRTANEGSAAGEATIDGNVAVFVSDEFPDCKITMTFLGKGKLQVRQQSDDCGFGHNVRADGMFRKVSSNKPTFGD